MLMNPGRPPNLWRPRRSWPAGSGDSDHLVAAYGDVGLRWRTGTVVDRAAAINTSGSAANSGILATKTKSNAEGSNHKVASGKWRGSDRPPACAHRRKEVRRSVRRLHLGRPFRIRAVDMDPRALTISTKRSTARLDSRYRPARDPPHMLSGSQQRACKNSGHARQTRWLPEGVGLRPGNQVPIAAGGK